MIFDIKIPKVTQSRKVMATVQARLTEGELAKIYLLFWSLFLTPFQSEARKCFTLFSRKSTIHPSESYFDFIINA